MYLKDVIYGEYSVEPVLEVLINSKPVQRLKGIHQGGASYLVNPKWNVTRYEHSVGVMLLIRKLGGSIEEQIAGLLHDVSHTAFSHVIDFALDHKDEDYHEKIFEAVVSQSEIPEILKQYGYDYRDIILDDSQWTILEQPAPDICADRIDYTLRDMYHYGVISKTEVNQFLNELILSQGKLCLTSIPQAEWFIETYYKEVIDFFMDPLNIYGYDRLANTIKVALERGVITLDDLLKEDKEVIQILLESGDAQVLSLVKQLNGKVNVIEDESDYDLHRKNKVRLINPMVLTDGQMIRATEVSKRAKLMNEQAYHRAINGTYVKVL